MRFALTIGRKMQEYSGRSISAFIRPWEGGSSPFNLQLLASRYADGRLVLRILLVTQHIWLKNLPLTDP